MKFNALIPELSVKDLKVSKTFYLDVLGFTLEYEREADKFMFLSLDEAQMMLEEINGYWNTGDLQYPFGRGINFQINTKDIQGIINRLKQHNIPLYRDLMENHYECNGITVVEHEILVQDPDGYLLRFSQTIEKVKSE